MSESPYPLVGLSGPAGAGKDHCARLLAASHGYVRVAFADRLREFVRTIDPAMAIAERVLGSSEAAKRHVPGYRERLIEVGSAAREKIYQDIWVDAVDLQVEETRDKRPVVVTDVRYLNEMNWLRECGGTLVYISRAGLDPEPSNDMLQLQQQADILLWNPGNEEFADRVQTLAELLEESDSS